MSNIVYKIRGIDGKITKWCKNAILNVEYEEIGLGYRIYYIVQPWFTAPTGLHRKGAPINYSPRIELMLDEKEYVYVFGENERGEYMDISHAAFKYLQYELNR